MVAINILQIVVVFLLYNAILVYIGWNASVWLRHALGFQSKWILIIVMGLLGYSFVIDRFTSDWTVLKIIGSYWMGIVQYAMLLLPIANLVVFLVNKYSAVSWKRLITWTGSLILICFAVIFAYGTYNAYTPVVHTYDIKVDKAIEGKNELRIVMASDMHFGVLSGKNHAERMVAEINPLQPDLVLYVGDIIDDDPTPFIEKKMDKDLAQITAPLGVYAVLGNHEYYGGKVVEFVETLEGIGVNVLRDNIVELDNGLTLIGRKDKTDQARKSVEDLAADADQTNPILLLDHQPDELEQAEANGIDLIVSGHTHRGQLAPNHFITNWLYENDWGYLKKGDMHSIVSSGYGFWGPPLRIGSQAEIVVIDVQFSQ
jgi:uncharacterized protein